MRLLIDQGNTRLKWRVVGNKHVVIQAGSCDSLRWQGLSQLRSSRSVRIADIWVCSVLAKDRQHELGQFLKATFEVDTHFAEVTQDVFGVHPIYKNLATLGVDRWVALLAIHGVEPQACVAVSAGSAITADFLDGGGGHQGGFIFPGLGLMRAALAAKSAALDTPYELDFLSEWRPGKTTGECLAAGVHAAVSGLVWQIESYASTHLQQPTVYVTGGDAQLMAPLFKLPCALRESLVLDGLARLASVS